MGYDLVKTRLGKYREQEQSLFEGSFLEQELLEEAGYTNKSKEESTYFNLKIRNKAYPSCYHYNLLVLAAKNLIDNDVELVCAE